MKNTILIIVFVALAVGIIAGGYWYSNKISNDSQQAALEQGSAAEQAQAKIMQNFIKTDDVVGTGAEAQNGMTVTVNYVGTLDNGSKFDSSYDRKQPFSFILGAGQVIQGWDLGVLGMRVGGKRTLSIPPELGYGAAGHPPVIPQNATLHFTIELLSVSTSTGM